VNQSKKLTIYALAFILMSVAISATVSATNGFDYGFDYEWDIAPEAGWLFGMTFALCIIFFVICFIIFIVIAIWVYKDAEKRGSNGTLWLIIVIITGIIGIIIWLIIRPPIGGRPQERTGRIELCLNCGRSIPFDAQICPYCGIKQQTVTQVKGGEIETFKKSITKTIKCPSCGEIKEVQGVIGERVEITCSKCNKKGFVRFR